MFRDSLLPVWQVCLTGRPYVRSLCSFVVLLSGHVGRGAVRPVALGVTAALIAALGLVAPAQAAPVAAPVKTAKVAKVESRPDLVSARITARAQGSRVEAESERLATSSTWVNPDGTLTTQQHAGPIRFRDSDGSWREVDLTLAEQADGSVAPRGHPGGLRLKGATRTASLAAPSATENDVVSTDEGKGGTRGVSLAWKGKLGRPTLAGNRATYAEVQPGVDLVVDVLRTGYEQSMVIKTRRLWRACPLAVRRCHGRCRPRRGG
jgi:hypothetical protein